jgi:hypothetical protein
MMSKAIHACAAAILALLAVGLSGPAVAQSAKYEMKRAVGFVNQLPIQTQKMSTESMLIALGVDVEENLADLAESHGLFQKVLTALRGGDDSIGVTMEMNLEFVALIDEVDRLWPPLDLTIRRVLQTGAAAAEDVAVIARHNGALLEAAERMAKAYGKLHGEPLVKSILAPITAQAGHQVVLIQQMSKTFLLLAYGQDADGNRQELVESHALFDRTLAGLIEGDPQLGLISAMTPAIWQQLTKVRGVWDEFGPLIKQAAEGGEVDPAAVRKAAGLMGPLDTEMAKAAQMYAAF